jgi:glycosyltransferase involved in cell wall biosynthesis
MSIGKLLYIGNKLSKKGSTITSIETLGGLLTQEGYTVYMASSVRNKYFRLLDMLWKTLRYSRRVQVVLIDTYSTQNFLYAVAVANLCRLLHLPYIPILRGGDLPRRLKKSKAASYKLFNGAVSNVAPSMYLYEGFKAEGYTNLTYIPNTLEIEKYPFFEREKPKLQLLWVRSFAAIYNPLMAIKVVEILTARGFSPSLCMVGPEKDSSLQECIKLATSRQLDVSFKGMLTKEEWISLSRDYDIFINTTNFDNTPVSVMEAMALGLPIISTNVGGIPYLIEDQIDGLLVPPEAPELFANAIQEVFSDAHKALSLSRKARIKAESFDWQKIKHSWNTLLNH